MYVDAIGALINFWTGIDQGHVLDDPRHASIDACVERDRSLFSNTNRRQADATSIQRILGSGRVVRVRLAVARGRTVDVGESGGQSVRHDQLCQYHDAQVVDRDGVLDHVVGFIRAIRITDLARRLDHPWPWVGRDRGAKIEIGIPCPCRHWVFTPGSGQQRPIHRVELHPRLVPVRSGIKNLSLLKTLQNDRLVVVVSCGVDQWARRGISVIVDIDSRVRRRSHINRTAVPVWLSVVVGIIGARPPPHNQLWRQVLRRNRGVAPIPGVIVIGRCPPVAWTRSNGSHRIEVRIRREMRRRIERHLKLSGPRRWNTE